MLWSTDDPRRGAALVAALLAATAVVGLGVGSLLGMTGDGAPDVSAQPETTTASPSPSTSTAPTKRAASQIEPGTTSDVGYFQATRTANDGTHVTFDRVLLLTGKDARAYTKAHPKKKPGPDGVLLVNDNTLTRDLVLAKDVNVLGAGVLAGSDDLQPVPLQTLLDGVAAHGRDLLLELTYDKLGYVIEVREHGLA